MWCRLPFAAKVPEHKASRLSIRPALKEEESGHCELGAAGVGDQFTPSPTPPPPFSAAVAWRANVQREAMLQSFAANLDRVLRIKVIGYRQNEHSAQI